MKLCWSYAHRGISRTNSNIYDGAFSTSVKPYLNELNLIELPLSFIFYTAHPFMKKLIIENFRRKNILFMEHFFFLKFEIMQWNGTMNKQKQPPEVSIRKGVLRNFTKFTGKRVYQSLFFNKVASGVFPVNFLKFLRTSF